jgi:Flp pilus assembly protein TadD
MSDNEDNGAEEYKVLADELKDQGNQAFQAGDVQGAIKFFSQAIDLDPDNHVYYSNRAAAYMKADSKSKALHDAEKCVELAPTWSKGYSRLGAAQQSLKRFDAATDNFKKCIELEPNNKSYWVSLKACQDAFEADKKVRFAAAQRERDVEDERLRLKEKVKKDREAEQARQKQEAELASFLSEVGGAGESSAQPQKSSAEAAVEDDLLADFFSAVSSTAEAAKPKPVVPEAEVEAKTADAGEETKDESVQTEKYVSQDLGDGRAQVERLLARHHEWRNLNPYYVLQLGADATEEDIKQRYRKLSRMVHPDRLRDMENAREAFEQVKFVTGM